MSPTLRTYCTGGDLFGVGAARAGWRVVDGYEIDPKKAAIARINGHDVRVADVTRMDMDALAAVDHEHWSPSCKTASQANSAGGETPDDIAVADACARSIAAHAARGGRSWSLENVWGYRNYESFARILAALTAADFAFAFDHVNMADFGVPQTRKRLILRAVRRSWRTRVPGLRPTHSKRGGAMLERWIGWLPSIADLLHALPETQPARWQQQRMGRLPAETTLIGAGGWVGGLVSRRPDEPAFTLAHGGDPNSTGNSAQIRALLVNGKNVNQEWGKGYRDDDEPAMSITADPKPSHMPVAYLSPERAWLLGDQSGHKGQGVILRADDEPAMTVRGGRRENYRAAVAGRWVKITLPCLARFQTVPDDYRALTAEINGNGVPPEFARRQMETLHDR